MDREHFKKFIIILAVIIFLIIFVAILFNKYPLSTNTNDTANIAPPPPAPVPPTAIIWNTYSFADPALGQIRQIPYPSSWVVQENFNRASQIAGVFIRPSGSLGNDRISIGGYGAAGGQFFSSCADIRLAESNQIRCDDSGGIAVATKSDTADVLKIYTLLTSYFKGEITL